MIFEITTFSIYFQHKNTYHPIVEQISLQLTISSNLYKGSTLHYKQIRL